MNRLTPEGMAHILNSNPTADADELRGIVAEEIDALADAGDPKRFSGDDWIKYQGRDRELLDATVGAHRKRGMEIDFVQGYRNGRLIRQVRIEDPRMPMHTRKQTYELLPGQTWRDGLMETGLLRGKPYRGGVDPDELDSIKIKATSVPREYMGQVVIAVDVGKDGGTITTLTHGGGHQYYEVDADLNLKSEKS